MELVSYGINSKKIINPVIQDNNRIMILNRINANLPISIDNFIENEWISAIMLDRLKYENGYEILDKPIKYNTESDLIKLLKDKELYL